ncbi:MAG TPA: hypothetical protein VGY54_27225 [Polyangiaceae bacterium]|jgi:hypothetical protein|nr:hypothetical protein [Polyangiaceae bacterium]
MHAVARELPYFDVRFTPFYGGLAVDAMRRLGLIEWTIGGDKLRGRCVDYLRDHGLRIDLHGREGSYDLVVTCTDLVVPDNVRGSRIVVVQEGILDPPGLLTPVCKRLKWLPGWLGGTALTGQSNLFDRFCVASEGYKALFASQGVDPRKLIVTGIPNFDDCARYLKNDFPHRGYVLVCTSDARETFKRDDRAALVRGALEVAGGRPLIFKLHPNEDHTRASAEIRRFAPGALVYTSGSAEEMIANADVVFTQWSSTAFVALALGKTVHSNFPIAELRRLLPQQNGGRSAKRIARVCREVLDSSLPRPNEPGMTPVPLAAEAVFA